MVVDTSPKALAMDTSEFFGKMLTEHVFNPLVKGKHCAVIERSIILNKGKLSQRLNIWLSLQGDCTTLYGK